MFNTLNFSVRPYTSDFANGVYILDQYVRQDFHDRYVVSEPDYISTLMSYIRLFLRSSKLAKNFYTFSNIQTEETDNSTVESKVLDRSLEIKCGCDALLIFRAGNKAKVCMFEAKSVIPSSKGYWDKPQDANRNISHFHDQLTRQDNWTDTAFIWELFINNQRPGTSIKNFDKYGSTCVWHKDAYEYSNRYIKDGSDYQGRKPILWNNERLNSCIEQSTNNFLNLEDILNHILFENKDKKKEIQIQDEIISLESKDFKTVRIPTNAQSIEDYKWQILKETGVKFVAYIEFNNISFNKE
ncbi:hypothetical protein [Nostoc sp. 'Peltigera membranacea cyanobiont' 232]|uniref:hypothetical protein n=1 Tax=Nostoc sp. 'Peltigera membranacea cyanobiont' 232 TaxID=2014531 RepID=UPI000B952619|nr:hypothetical protein [Nostoc sp. 'Peltigera membranacea cyanobiont' 232]OYE00008.1 hypothetical protein CDG79_37625 [Nostoc sp. 'Peltigera membranacea cyanobiont' 232]